ncbi:MAG: beta-propeller fold lactonase family protein [Acidobacteria bacterium]|nr:beta-propeller fold lactonase family protein [Acidobacteriota bacterium]
MPGALAVAALALARYLSPIELALSPDGTRLYVVCEGSDELAVVDLATDKVIRRVRVGHVPKGLALAPDGRFVYVANSWNDTVSEIDTGGLEVRRTLPAGYEPTCVATDRAGRTLYAANRIGGDISVIDLATGAEPRRLAAGRGASYLALSPANGHLYATHIYPNPGPHGAPPESEITVIDAQDQVVRERFRLPNSAGVFHLAFSADGKLGLACQLRPKNLVPLAHVAHGWAIGNSLALFGEEVGEPVHIPLDEIDRYFSLPFGVAIAPDKRSAYVTMAGSDSVTVLDLERLLALVRRLSPKERARLANDLSASAQYVRARIPVGANPKGLALAPDGARLYVANRLDDSISVIATGPGKVVRTIPLGGPATLTPERRGERLFHTARFSFQGQFGCASCHLEGTLDGLTWDLEPDGFGIDIVDNRLVEDVTETAPFKWNGGNPDLETECGPRTEKYFFRAQSYSPTELADLVRFLKSIPPRPNRFRPAGDELTSSQERGKAIYERTRRKDGTPVPEAMQCPVCHSGPYYTNRQLSDVGSGKPTDRSPFFDVPQLTNIALSAPYLHDGSARTLEEIWTVFNPRDTHGVTNDLAKDELNDLIEYLKTL